MSTARMAGCLALGAFLLGACEPRAQRPAVNYGGMQEQQLRTQQLRGATSGANPGVQNPVPTAVNPGVGGIERAATGGSGSVGAGTPSAVNPGTTGVVRQPGVGAPTR